MGMRVINNDDDDDGADERNGDAITMTMALTMTPPLLMGQIHCSKNILPGHIPASEVLFHTDVELRDAIERHLLFEIYLVPCVVQGNWCKGGWAGLLRSNDTLDWNSSNHTTDGVFKPKWHTLLSLVEQS